MKAAIAISTLFLLGSINTVSAASFVDSSTHEEANFNNGSLNPFKVCTTAGGNSARVISSRVKFVWKEAEYRTRRTRIFQGAEICAERTLARQQVHTGFKLYIPKNSGNIRFPSNANTIIWQNFMLGGCSSWGAILTIKNNDLYIDHRGHCGRTRSTKILSNLPRNTWLNFQVHTKASRIGTGFVHIRVNGQRIYLANNINFGFGRWSNDTQLATNSKQEIKFGMYAADVNTHTTNEVRTLYFDNISVYTRGGSAGWRATDPR